MPPIDDAARLAAEVRDRLPAEGYVHVARVLGEEVFTAAANQLGTIELRTDIRVDSEADEVLRRARDPLHADRPSVYRADGLSYHTDSPVIDMLAWYCVAQDAIDGTSALIDTGDVMQHFDADDLEVMSRIGVRTMMRDAGNREIACVFPLFAEGKLYYAPWLLSPDLGERERDVADRFAGYVAEKDATAPIRIRLKPGEMLFVDNHRILHGRSSIPPDSRRHLIRLYIKARP
ncbi:MAG TPA: TauD/TfdA family dioxygenase [Thermoanaerobaculia bacterium]